MNLGEGEAAIVGYDDWHGLFFRDECVIEGHGIDNWHIANLINNNTVTALKLFGGEELYEWLLERGRFECKFSEIPEELLESYD